MKRPALFELDAAATAEVRKTEGVAMIVEWLEWERAQAADGAVRGLLSGDEKAAGREAAMTFVVDILLARLNTEAPIAEITDEEFHDSAQRPTRKDRNAQAR